MTRPRRRRSPRRLPLRRAVLVTAIVAAATVAVVQLRTDEPALGAPSAVPPLLVAAPAEPPTTASGLDPELERRFAAAQAAAAADGVTLTLTSGRRSAEEQQALVDDAVRRYGSLAEARRWVLPPESSAHVQGLAIDVGPTEGALWLGEHGREHGLCRTYANEMWHFEMLPDGAEHCPPLHPDSSTGW